jgi:hypothetical protein
MQKEYGLKADPLALWGAHIAGRDYAGASALLDTVQAAELSPDAWRILGIPDIDLARIITGRFQDAQEGPRPRLSDMRAKLERQRDLEARYFDTNRYLAMAFIAALEGNTAETERLVRVWLREATQDLTELAMLRHYACRALGLAAATSAAVECIRSGLAEPSLVMPFVEPYLPYYDSMRDQPAFVDLLTEVQDQ